MNRITEAFLDATTSDPTDPTDLGVYSSRDDAKASARAAKAAKARNMSGRRRLVDPTTCDRDYSNAELELMTAMHEYKRTSGRMFPTWSEVLEVVKGLGYRKMD